MVVRGAVILAAGGELLAGGVEHRAGPILEDVGQRGAEDPRPLAGELGPAVQDERELPIAFAPDDAGPVGSPLRAREPLRPGLGVAIDATRANSSAAFPRVERCR